MARRASLALNAEQNEGPMEPLTNAYHLIRPPYCGYSKRWRLMLGPTLKNSIA